MNTANYDEDDEDEDDDEDVEDDEDEEDGNEDDDDEDGDCSEHTSLSLFCLLSVLGGPLLLTITIFPR